MATPKKPALGRNLSSMGIQKGEGLNALLKGVNDNSNNPSIDEIPLNLIDANPQQPRTDFDEDALNELSESIKQLGIIQPVTLRKLDTGRYQIISGERRCRASRLAGLQKIPAYIRPADDDKTMLELALVENIQREDLDPIEIAISFQRMIEECGFTQENLGDRVGKQRSTVTNFLRLLKLPDEIKLGLRHRLITMGHAKALLSVDDVNDQTFLFERILNEGLSVRETEEIAREMKDGQSKQQKGKKSKNTNDNYKELEEKLKNFFNSKVKFSRTDKGNGKIVISFSNDQDLERLISLFDKINSI